MRLNKNKVPQSCLREWRLIFHEKLWSLAGLRSTKERLSGDIIAFYKCMQGVNYMEGKQLFRLKNDLNTKIKQL